MTSGKSWQPFKSRHFSEADCIRGPCEETIATIKSFYDQLLTILKQQVLRDGSWQLLEYQPAWRDNWTNDCFIARREFTATAAQHLPFRHLVLGKKRRISQPFSAQVLRTETPKRRPAPGGSGSVQRSSPLQTATNGMPIMKI